MRCSLDLLSEPASKDPPKTRANYDNCVIPRYPETSTHSQSTGWAVAIQSRGIRVLLNRGYVNLELCVSPGQIPKWINLQNTHLVGGSWKEPQQRMGILDANDRIDERIDDHPSACGGTPPSIRIVCRVGNVEPLPTASPLSLPASCSPAF